jgi:hypothetical protein
MIPRNFVHRKKKNYENFVSLISASNIRMTHLAYNFHLRQYMVVRIVLCAGLPSKCIQIALYSKLSVVS